MRRRAPRPARPRPRAVIAPRAQFVPLLIDATQFGRIRSGSFALTSPQRFAGLVRAHHGQAVLDAALRRLPDRLAARRGMTGAQIAAVGARRGSCSRGCQFRPLEIVASAALWLTFSAAIVLRSWRRSRERGSPSYALTDDELPVYTVVVALYQEPTSSGISSKRSTRSIIPRVNWI